MDSADRHALRRRIRALTEPLVERCGCDLVAVEITGDRQGPILRLVIDRPGGVDIDDCTRVTHAVSPELDVEDPLDAPYRLEVSSPGIERPVERPEDFARFAGYRARLRLGKRKLAGVLRGWEDGAVLLEVAGELRRLDPSTIDRAHLDLDLDEYEALGRDGLPPVPASSSAGSPGASTGPAGPRPGPAEGDGDDQ